MIYAPSLLAANFLELGNQCDILLKNNFKWLHYDVMDGYFVPNHSFGAAILSQIKAKYPFICDVHLMVATPDIFIEYYKSLADVITIHIEACAHSEEAKQLCRRIQSYGIKAGISIKPNTSIAAIEDLLKEVDLVLVMSVEPGFGGQAFMPNSLDKVKTLKALKERYGYSYIIQIDGGITATNANLVQDAGVENCVVGSYMFANFPQRLQEFV